MSTFHRFAAVAAIVLLPGLAFAAGMPVAGDVLGTDNDALTAALAAAGCPVDAIGTEDGMIEAKCTNAEGEKFEVYIDPTTGAVAEVEEDE